MAIPVLLMANNASSTLASAISNVSLTCTLSAGSGALFPSPGANQYFLMTFVDAATQTLREIVQCTARSGDTLTIVRAQEGTTALAWNANDLAVNMITAGTLQTYSQISQVQAGQFNYAVDSGTANNIIVNTVPSVTPPVDGMQIVFKVAASNTGACTITFNGLTAVPLYGPNYQPLQGGELVGTGMINAVYNISNRWIVLSKQAGAWPVATATQSNQAVNLSQMNSAIALSPGRLLNIRYIVTTGTYTPTAGTTAIYVQGVGTGGNGGGSTTNNSTACTACGGGGSGAYAEAYYTSGFSGVTVTIGALGAVNYGTGATGATSSFGTLMVLSGGAGGPAVASTNATVYLESGGGAGGTATLSGQVSGVTSQGNYGFGGKVFGGSATSGIGASSVKGNGGGNGSASSGGAAGGTASGRGAGGGGAAMPISSTQQYGGNGSLGMFVVWEYA